MLNNFKRILILGLILLFSIILIESCQDDPVNLPPLTDKDTSSIFSGQWQYDMSDSTDTLHYSVSINYYLGTYYGSADLNLASFFKFTSDSSRVMQFIQTGKISISVQDSIISYYFTADSAFHFTGMYNSTDETISGELQSEDAGGKPRNLQVILKKKTTTN